MFEKKWEIYQMKKCLLKNSFALLYRFRLRHYTQNIVETRMRKKKKYFIQMEIGKICFLIFIKYCFFPFAVLFFIFKIFWSDRITAIPEQKIHKETFTQRSSSWDSREDLTSKNRPFDGSIFSFLLFSTIHSKIDPLKKE